MKYYHEIAKCRLCFSEMLSGYYHSDPIPVAGIYYPDGGKPLNVKSPVTLAMCGNCGLVQLKETVNPDIYSDYSFSGCSIPSYRAHVERLADMLLNEHDVKGKRVFNVGASDGEILQFLKDKGGNQVSGVEPSGKLCKIAQKKGLNVQQGYFNREYLKKNEVGRFDCAIIRHVMEHIDDLNEMAECLAAIIKDDGILLVEVPDVDEMFSKKIYSNVYHEHLIYFSIDTLDRLMKRRRMQPKKTVRFDIHGGSFLTLYGMSKSGDAAGKYQQPDDGPISDFSRGAKDYFNRINRRVGDLLNQGKAVHGYGASHRTFILLGNSGIGSEEMPVIYDMNKLLQGRRLNGIHSIVEPPENILNNNPDAIAILALSYEREITSYLRGELGYDGEIISLKDENL